MCGWCPRQREFTEKNIRADLDAMQEIIETTSVRVSARLRGVTVEEAIELRMFWRRWGCRL